MVIERSRKLGVLDIRIGKEYPSLEDYWKALDMAEEIANEITDEIFDRAFKTGAKGIKI